MKKETLRPICLLMVLSSAAFLVSCGGSGSSASYASKPYTVSYYDDAPTPNLVGYSYVMKGANAETMGHRKAYEDGSYYDYASRSGAMVSAVGSHWVFDGFSGTYADNTPVVLTSISGDCSVYAHFKEIGYTYDIVYYNDDNEVNSAASQLGIRWATPVALPSLLSYQQPNYADPSLTPDGNWGYDYVNPSDNTLTKPDFYADKDTAKVALPAKWTFTSGPADPTGSADAGTVYAVTALNDSHKTNPTYPIYLSNGTSWILLGNLASGLKIVLRAVYTPVKHTFTVTFYDQKPTASVAANALATLKVPFNEVFALSADGTDVTATYNTLTSTFKSAHKTWTGFYTNTIKSYENKTVSDLRMMADCSFYPAD